MSFCGASEKRNKWFNPSMVRFKSRSDRIEERTENRLKEKVVRRGILTSTHNLPYNNNLHGCTLTITGLVNFVSSKQNTRWAIWLLEKLTWPWFLIESSISPRSLGRYSAIFFCFRRGKTSQKRTDINDLNSFTRVNIQIIDKTAPGWVSEINH